MRPFLIKSNRDDEGATWIVIWGDMLAVILTFFILLVGISEIDTAKYSEIATELSDSLGGSLEGELGSHGKDSELATLGIKTDLIDLNTLAKKIKEAIAEQNLEEALDITIDHRGAVLSAPGETFFKSGEADILGKGVLFLRKLSALLKTVPYNILVEGHTDDVPINTPRYPSNWELSTGRASSVVRFFIEEENIPPQRLSAAGYAEYKPRFPQIPENRAKNRRVEIIILRKKK
ncbi:MAG TPA: OmpA family protein [Nitrospinota bacterium]|nr:OmpA family protein [Nitrospinota bacterium]